MKTYLASILIFASLTASAAFAEDIGWRGDGSGIFPDSHPPTTWSRTAQTVLAHVSCAAERPPRNAPGGDPVSPQSGMMSHWLVLGPLPGGADAAKALESTPLRDEVNLDPKAGDKVGELQWQ